MIEPFKKIGAFKLDFATSILLQHKRKCPVCCAEFLPEVAGEVRLQNEATSPSAPETKHIEEFAPARSRARCRCN